MIEMHYDESKNKIKLPKNIRQVGKPGDKSRIYVEDYVITYVNQISRESSEKQRLAVLLGRQVSQDEQKVVFVDGALEVKNIAVTDDQIALNSEIWTALYEEIAQYFHHTEIVGWFLTRPGKSLEINEKITKTHTEHFKGEEKVLMVSDPIDHEDAFYIYKDGALERQDGYYIYYERNEDMQNYLIDHHGAQSSENELKESFIKKREQILSQRQAKLPSWLKKGEKLLNAAEEPEDDQMLEAQMAAEEPKKKRGDTLIKKEMTAGLRRASSLAVTFGLLFALIFGFSQLKARDSQQVSSHNADGNTDFAVGNDLVGDDAISVDVIEDNVQKLNELGSGDLPEIPLGALETSDTETSDNEYINQTSAGDETEYQDIAGNSEDDSLAIGSELMDDSATDVANAADVEQNVSEDVPVQNVIRQYEVVDGDTLAGISQRFYNSYKYIEMIQEMNQIEDADRIYPGMKLKLP